MYKYHVFPYYRALITVPNNITNIVRVISEDAKQVQNALMSLMSPDGCVDFNRLIPMPKILQNTSSPNYDTGIDCLEQTGYLDWYSWSLANWGTKWNGYDVSFDGLKTLPFRRWHRKKLKNRNRRLRMVVETCYAARIDKKRFKKWVKVHGLNSINFDTAWRCPRPVFVTLSKKYPELTFEITYADEDIGSNCGRYQLKNGYVISTNEAGRWSKMSEEEKHEWRVFALKVRGYTPKEVKEYLAECDS
ncbi:hypothetical protein OTK49_20930 [Vibrio coralliirubri]|uniref:DUF1281 family ferredoxin-like fold protein n=1 Tax=Vibrio coralliirubri TaxID=1516159 RepID=UPI0022835ABB|nr:hypothetical protein [Vibrio coralliirubri]MCY9864984.1 hypothetical protein [Vibrio coralliirubri]